MNDAAVTAPAPAEVKPARGCSNYVHYRLAIDTNIERCPNCGGVLHRGAQKSKCRAHGTYACNQCFSFEEIAEFARYREATGRMM